LGQSEEEAGPARRRCWVARKGKEQEIGGLVGLDE